LSTHTCWPDYKQLWLWLPTGKQVVLGWLTIKWAGSGWKQLPVQM